MGLSRASAVGQATLKLAVRGAILCANCHPIVDDMHNVPSRSGITMLSRYSIGTPQGTEFKRNSSENARPQSSQLAEPLWTDPGLKSGIGVCEVMFTKKCF